MVVLSDTGSPVSVLEAIGIVGIGVAIVLFVVLGNPSAGGAYQLPLLPGFWRTIGDTLPNGAGVLAATTYRSRTARPNKPAAQHAPRIDTPAA
jgi:hypothetical protein